MAGRRGPRRGSESTRRENDESRLLRQMSVPTEVHLRRMRVRAALDKLDRYLNDATVAGLPWVRVIHGKGTGTLKAAVIEHLSSHSLVTRHHPAPPSEGGGGATIAVLE